MTDPSDQIAPRTRRAHPVARASRLALLALTFAAGFVLGAAAIHRPIPDAPIELPPARTPWKPKDVAGLVGSIGIRTLAHHLTKLPFVVVETDKTFALSMWSRSRIWRHYVIVPKKDLRDIGSLSSEDESYLTDVFLVTRHLIERDHLRDYRFYTNGPGPQAVAYLHFHLVAKRPH